MDSFNGYKFIYPKITRFDILCRFDVNPIHPCEICNKTECRGEAEECKNNGAWSYGIKM